MNEDGKETSRYIASQPGRASLWSCDSLIEDCCKLHCRPRKADPPLVTSLAMCLTEDGCT